ncbi:MAG TPA: pantoate--beta-alanine ligase [Acidimicrobiia bacterium]|nr:pantoate--beta-alanine ligase [Acidimicrobiia bacterium]
MKTFSEARTAAAGRVGLVPTMGFLHEGHLSLIERAVASADTVIVSSYVNPLQFGAGEDLERYPRNPDRDRALIRAVGADILFAPPLAEMYPEEPRVTVQVSGLTDDMEGAHRPGHFTGVATVVTKLFAGLRPDLAFFGRKDAQQLAVVRRLARDLSFPVEIVGCPTVRESDGLALSSRNSYLGVHDREEALGLSRGLMAAADAIDGGELSGRILEGLAAARSGLDLDYAELRSQDDAARLDLLDRPAFLAVAATVGPARLIDNIHVDWVDGCPQVDRGRRLDHPSLIEEG